MRLCLVILGYMWVVFMVLCGRMEVRVWMGRGLERKRVVGGFGMFGMKRVWGR